MKSVFTSRWLQRAICGAAFLFAAPIAFAQTPPNLVGKQVKEVSTTTQSYGSDVFSAITITFTDGTLVMASQPKAQGRTPPNPGAFLVYDAKGCPFAVS